MAKKKKEEEIEVEQEEDFNYEEDAETPIHDDQPSSSLELAHQISKTSETAKHFKELPREVKYSFLDSEEKKEIKHFSRTYRNHQYIEKIIDLRVKEDERLKDSKQKVNLIESRADLIIYLKKCNRDYLINDIIDLNEKEIEKILLHVKTLKQNYMLDTIESRKEEIKTLYTEYKKETNTPSYIDDIGNIGKIMDTSVASMGFKGNASSASVMTIQAVKNEDIQKTAEENRKFGFMDAIKRKLG